MKQELPEYQIHLLDLLFPYLPKRSYINWMLANKEFKDRLYLKLYTDMSFRDLPSFLSWLDRGVHSYCYSLNVSQIFDSLSSVPETWLKSLLTKSHNLTILDLSHCWFLTDENIAVLTVDDKFKRSFVFPSLSSLDLSSTGITDHALCRFLTLAPNLKRLILIDVGCIGPLFKAYIWEKRLQSIYELMLDGNEDVDDELLIVMAKHCLSLSKLSISRCNVTDYGVVNVLNLPHLWNINVAYCTKVTNKILSTLKLPKLTSFQAIGTNFIFDAKCLRQLSIHCLECLIIGYNTTYNNADFMAQFPLPSTTAISPYSEELPIGSPQILPLDLKYFYYLRRVLFIIEDAELFLPMPLIQQYIDMAKETNLVQFTIVYKGHALHPIDIHTLQTTIKGPKYLNGEIITTTKHIEVGVKRDWVETNHVQFKLQ